MLLRKKTLAIVDDHPIVIEGLVGLLSKRDDLEIVRTFTNGQELVCFLAHNPVDIVLLDIFLPDGNGMDVCQQIKTLWPTTIVLALSNHEQRGTIMKMLQNGASGYLLKNSTVGELNNCIDEALNGQIAFSLAVKEIIARPELDGFREFAKLTSREKEVLKLIASGITTIDMANQLFLSKFTIESHRKNLLQKFKAKNMAELIKAATEQGFL